MADVLSVLDPANPEVVRYRERAPELVEVARALVIATDDDLAAAAEHTKAATQGCKDVRGLFKPAKQALDAAKKQITALEAALLDGFEKADAILRAKVTAYHRARQVALEAERRQREQEERKRREEEQLAQALRLEELAKQTGADHYRRAADFALSQPVRTPVVAAPAPAKVKGLSFREETGVDVVDLGLLVAAVASGAVSRDAVLANVAWLRTEAKQRGTAVKDGDELFPGVVVTKTSDVTVRTR